MVNIVNRDIFVATKCGSVYYKHYDPKMLYIELLEKRMFNNYYHCHCILSLAFCSSCSLFNIITATVYCPLHSAALVHCLILSLPLYTVPCILQLLFTV